MSRDPEFGWARAEIKRVFGLNEEFFKSSNWPIDEVHDAVTSMQVRRAASYLGCVCVWGGLCTKGPVSMPLAHGME